MIFLTKFTPPFFVTLVFSLLVLTIYAHPRFIPKFKGTKNGMSSKNGNTFLGPRLQCAICKLAAAGIVDIYSKQSTDECIEAIAIKVCELFHIDDVDDMVCSSIIPQFLDEVLYVFGKILLAPNQLCNFLLQDQCGNAYRPKQSQWNVTFPHTTKPPVTPPTLPEQNAPKLKVLHLSDIHYDKLYQPGSDVNCQEPLCCRLYENPDDETYAPAGQWGNPHGNCDVPLWTVEDMFQRLQTINETFDYVIWTGDLPSHNVWNQTKSDQLAAYKTLTDMFLKYFPNKKIYSAVGNHESSPVNNFPPHYPDLPKQFNISWLYDALAESWTHWVNKSQISSIQNIASYVEKPFPGLRIISLNTMMCYSDNYWVFINETDPDGTLSWLISQLQEAEDVGDKVHIIGHILTGSCMPQWSLNYFNIIYRYEDTVRGQFFGHSHSDQFSVFYENQNYTQRPFSMYYVGPSVTTYSDRNPAYRIYTIDGNYENSTWRVLDHDTYYLDLKNVNANNVTNWGFEYNAKSAYNLSTLFPDDWSNLIERMKNEDSVFRLYNTFYDRQVKDCEGGCKQDKLCETRSAVSNYENTLCTDIYSSGGESELYEFEQPDWLEPIVNRWLKAFPEGINIEVPQECQPSTGQPTTETKRTTPKEKATTQGVCTPQECPACTTPTVTQGDCTPQECPTCSTTTSSCYCGSATSLKSFFLLLFITCFFVLWM